MRIATLNTWKNEGDYDCRLALMATGLQALAPDVLCLQECFVGAGRDTAAHLGVALRRQVTAAPARHKPRMHLGNPTPSSSGLAILTRTAPLASATLQLPQDHRDGERIALRVDLPGVRVLNLHLTHLQDDAGRDWRALQLEVAVAWARRDWRDALVVCGDLNMNQCDPAFAPLRGLAGVELGSTLHGAGGGAIDHIILLHPPPPGDARRWLALTEADDQGRRPSDHAAVVADFEPTT